LGFPPSMAYISLWSSGAGASGIVPVSHGLPRAPDDRASVALVRLVLVVRALVKVRWPGMRTIRATALGSTRTGLRRGRFVGGRRLGLIRAADPDQRATEQSEPGLDDRIGGGLGDQIDRPGRGYRRCAMLGPSGRARRRT